MTHTSMIEETELRKIPGIDRPVTPVAMGCWPITGMTSIDVNETDSEATLQAAYVSGINFFDTAYCYGPNGESERMIAKVLGAHRNDIVIATKCGVFWDEKIERQVDGRPETLRRHCEESLQRLNTDRVELMYLHTPDPAIPIGESAGALKQLMDEGKALTIGLSNASVEQLEAFHAECPISAFQPPYNMLQRQIERDTLPWCSEREIATAIYWPLMKGLLAGKLSREHIFSPSDGRAKYPMFQGEEWQKNQDFIDSLREIADGIGKTVCQVVVNWTIHRPGISVALCGAKRAYQIEEIAGAMGWKLTDGELNMIDDVLAARGNAITKPAI